MEIFLRGVLEPGASEGSDLWRHSLSGLREWQGMCDPDFVAP